MDRKPWRDGLRWLGAALVAGATGLGCAAAQVSTAEIAEPQSAIRAAEAVGAERLPTASLYLKLARDEMEFARQLLERGDADRARMMLLRARADAELALVVSREASVKAEARRAVEQVRKLQTQTP